MSKKNMVMMGVIKSKFPAKQGREAITYVTHTALSGSLPLGEAKEDRKGTTPSLAIAANSLGAPVSDCNPAPTELIIIPIFTNIEWGKAIDETMSLSSFKMSFEKKEPISQIVAK